MKVKVEVEELGLVVKVERGKCEVLNLFFYKFHANKEIFFRSLDY